MNYAPRLSFPLVVVAVMSVLMTPRLRKSSATWAVCKTSNSGTVRLVAFIHSFIH